jgi:hypothetical protein
MNSTRWKLLMAYLPAIASVVNTFQNSEVQLRVFDALLGALDEKALAENGLAVSQPLSGAPTQVSPSESGVDITNGSSIHELVGKIRV